MATHPKRAIPKTPMESFVQASPDNHITMLLWMNRFNNPEMAVTVTEADVKAFQDCMTYLKVIPSIKVSQRNGRATIALLEKDTEIRDKKTQEIVSQGNAIKAVENNEADFQRAEQSERIRMIRQNAPQLANAIKVGAMAGEFSSDLILQAAEALQVLSA